MNLQVKKFTKVDEPFICQNCGKQVFPSIEGSCRNHCPNCLYSNHLDINPGDRKSMCKGLMKPIDIELKHGKYRILHKCLKCGFQRWNKSAQDDKIIEFYEKKKIQES